MVQSRGCLAGSVLVQLQNPQNDEDNADEKEDDAADADDDNEDEYQYHQRKEANRRPNDGRLHSAA